MSDTRLVPNNRTVYDQADLFDEDGARIEGVEVSSLVLLVFFNNSPQAWDIVDGTSVSDNELRSGRLYFNELNPGYYGFRFRPSATGHWRLAVTYEAGAYSTTVLKDYDVFAASPSGPSIYASFFKA